MSSLRQIDTTHQFVSGATASSLRQIDTTHQFVSGASDDDNGKAKEHEQDDEDGVPLEPITAQTYGDLLTTLWFRLCELKSARLAAAATLRSTYKPGTYAYGSGATVQIEMEARIGIFGLSTSQYAQSLKFKPTVPFGRWSILRKMLDSMDIQMTELKILSQEWRNLNYRERQTDGGPVIRQIKTSQLPIDSDFLNWTRHGFAVEMTIPSRLPAAKNINPEQRTLQRFSYDWQLYNCRIDLTADGMSYAIEVEMNNPDAASQDDVIQYLKCTREVVRLMNGSLVYFDLAKLQQFNAFVNANLMSQRSNRIDALTKYVDLKSISQPEALTMDMIPQLAGNYSVAYKINGVFAILVLSQSGIWLSTPTYYTNCLADICPVIEDDEVSIVLVEVLDPYAPIIECYVSEVFIIAGVDYTTVPLVERIQPFKDYYKTLETQRVWCLNRNNTLCTFPTQQPGSFLYFYPRDKLIVHFKSILPIRKGDNIGEIVEELIRRASAVVETTAKGVASSKLSLDGASIDGLIFTPSRDGYTNKLKILKWKPPELVTIDLRVWIEDGVTTLRYDNRTTLLTQKDPSLGQKEVNFLGTSRNPFDFTKMIDTQGHTLVHGSVVEFGWDGTQLVYLALRDLKSAPNSEKAALGNWELAVNPITIETIAGRGLYPIRFTHNRIKRDLLARFKGRLLDIGTGRGGDIEKWKNYNHITAVEPNPDNLAVLKQRLQNSDMNTKVHIIPTTAQDLPLLSEQYDVIALMDSGTFFWQDRPTLERLVEIIHLNLKPSGVVLWKMLDGDAVRILRNGTGEVYINYPGFSITKTKDISRGHINDRSVLTSFGGRSIVGNDQLEYLPRISDFYKLLGSDYEIEQQDRASHFESLQHESLAISKLYLYGIIRNTKAAPFTPTVAVVTPVKPPLPTERISLMGGRIDVSSLF
jgi:hypothetical protein